MSGMFNGASVFNNGQTTNLGTKSFTSTAGGKWDTGAVFGMSAMFQLASAFNQDVSSWDTHLVTDMSGMFNGASVFNNGQTTNLGTKPFTKNVNIWNTGAVLDMSAMFSSASAFNQDVSSWTLTKKPTITHMFSLSLVPTGLYNTNIWYTWQDNYNYIDIELTAADLIKNTRPRTTNSYPLTVYVGIISFTYNPQ